jgi:hypothetical protein
MQRHSVVPTEADLNKSETAVLSGYFQTFVALPCVFSRTLRPGYSPQKSYHISAMMAALAQLLHCAGESSPGSPARPAAKGVPMSGRISTGT